MSTYLVREGDTLATVSRRVYNTENQTGLILRANPGLGTALVPGTVITVPPLAIKSQATAAGPASDPDETALFINDKRFRFWTDITLTRSMSAVSSLAFNANWDPDNSDLRDAVRPYQYQDAVVSIGGQAQFTGTVLAPAPTIAADARTVSVSGYSRTGVLGDCPAMASPVPRQFDGQTLREIAVTLCQPFGIAVVFAADVGAPFEKVGISTGEIIYSFLAKLAKLRQLVLSDTGQGELLFQQSVKPGNPVLTWEEGQGGITLATPTFTPQQYFSSVTGIGSQSSGSSSVPYTVQNPHAKGVVRPFTFAVADGDDTDVKAATEAKAASMFANAVSYQINTPSWRDEKGRLWQPNTTVSLKAPSVFIFERFEFIVRSVAYFRNDQQKTAILTLALPGAYEGVIPKSLPWDE